jgi:hypothetical protein
MASCSISESCGTLEAAFACHFLVVVVGYQPCSCACRLRKLANMEGSVSATYDLFEQEVRGNGRVGSASEEPTPEEVADRKARMLMDRVACGEIRSWDEIRPKMVAYLQAAGHEDAATFVEMSTRMQV